MPIDGRQRCAAARGPKAADIRPAGRPRHVRSAPVFRTRGTKPVAQQDAHASNLSDHIRRLLLHAVERHPAWPRWSIGLDVDVYVLLGYELADRAGLPPQVVGRWDGSMHGCDVQPLLMRGDLAVIAPRSSRDCLGICTPPCTPWTCAPAISARSVLPRRSACRRWGARGAQRPSVRPPRRPLRPGGPVGSAAAAAVDVGRTRRLAVCTPPGRVHGQTCAYTSRAACTTGF